MKSIENLDRTPHRAKHLAGSKPQPDNSFGLVSRSAIAIKQKVLKVIEAHAAALKNECTLVSR